MYQILLVDDEPIILSGIKFLIDWEALDCSIIGTARNGQQALESLDELHPDIVICDISMPVLSGMEVLKKANESHPEIVFIMLTNYSEFDLARESLRLKAVDYLLKTQLEAETLEQSLRLAIQERKQRRKILKVNFVEDYISTNKLSIIRDNIKKIAAAKNRPDLEENYHILLENGCLSQYALLEIILDFSTVPNLEDFTGQDMKRSFEFEKDVIKKLLNNFYSSFVILQEENSRRFIVYLWDLPQSYSESVKKLYKKLNNASENVTQVKLSLLATSRFSGQEQLLACFSHLRELEAQFYLNAEHFLFDCNVKSGSFTELAVSGFINRLPSEIKSKNIEQCKQIFEKIKSEFSGSNHKRSEAISFCIDLYSTVYSVAATLRDTLKTEPDCFQNSDYMIRQLKTLLTRQEILGWIDGLEKLLLFQLEELSLAKSDIMEKAQNYIFKNIDKRILLQDVADHINISPNYLSALFKKQYNQNFVDYVNMEKMKRACELIQGNKHLIYEISYMLGFENAYYFTKVFKRHIGCTPTEYQWKCKNEHLNNGMGEN